MHSISSRFVCVIPTNERVNGIQRLKCCGPFCSTFKISFFFYSLHSFQLIPFWFDSSVRFAGCCMCSRTVEWANREPTMFARNSTAETTARLMATAKNRFSSHSQAQPRINCVVCSIAPHKWHKNVHWIHATQSNALCTRHEIMQVGSWQIGNETILRTMWTTESIFCGSGESFRFVLMIGQHERRRKHSSNSTNQRRWQFRFGRKLSGQTNA